MNPALLSSKCANWRTPPEVLEAVQAVYTLSLDVCASPGHQVCARFFSPEDDSLSLRWRDSIDCGAYGWMNPPYGRGIGKWIAKADATASEGRGMVCLLPSRTDTQWWHLYCEPVLRGKIPGEVIFLRGRIRFLTENGDRADPAPFPSVIVIFHARGP